MTVIARIVRSLSRLVVAVLALAVLLALLVGVPWGLAHYIGWPLPGHIPTADEIRALLLNPMSVTLLLNVLACIAWPVWLAFVIDVIRCLPDAFHGVHRPSRGVVGPMHVLTAALVGAVVLSVFGPRTASTPTADMLQPLAPAVATYQPSDVQLASLQTAAHALMPTPQSDTAVVQEPLNGVHDSLWRIAARELGDGARWPELWRLNQDKTMTDGRIFDNPNLIQPRWVLAKPMSTPTPTAAPNPGQNGPGQSKHEGEQSQPAPTPAPSPNSTPATKQPATTGAAQPQPTATAAQEVGILLPTGGFVALGLTGIVTAALTVQRLRRRRRYRPGTGDTDLPPMTPVVRALRIAHDELLDIEDPPNTEDNNPVVPRPAAPTTSESAASDVRLPVGVRDGRAQAVQLAQLHGLGLTGAGAEATARALLVHLLATPTTTLIMPAADVTSLLGTDLTPSARLRITNDLDTAISELGSDVRERVDNPGRAGIVLVATVETPADPRLQAVLDNGSSLGITGILLGYWPAGGTVRVRADGVVGAASPGLDDTLVGAQLFHLDASDTRDLANLFTDAVPAPQPVSKADGGEPQRTGPDRIPAVRAYTEVPSSTTPVDENVPQAKGSSEEVFQTSVDDRGRQRPAMSLSILGPPTLIWRTGTDEHDLTTALAPLHRKLLVFLALYPAGTTREDVREALWPDATGRRPYNPFYATLSQIREKLDAATDGEVVEIFDRRGERIGLDASLVEVDYWEFHDAEHASRVATDDAARRAAMARIAAAYHGEVAEGISVLWLDGPREAAHRVAVNALAGLAAMYGVTDPQRRLQILEHARLLDPHNEDVYRDIMRTQAELGLTDTIIRTLALLTTTLSEIGEKPQASTITLAHALQDRRRRMAAS